MFSLSYHRLRRDIIEIFQFVHGQSTGCLSDMLEFNDTARGRGCQFSLVMKQYETRLRQSLFCRRAVGHWNKLPTAVDSVSLLT